MRDVRPGWDPERRRRSLAASLLVVGTGLEHARAGNATTPLVESVKIAGGFGFLVGVLADFGMPAERVWRIPNELRSRLGTLEPMALRDRVPDIGRAFRTRPILHRFPDQVAGFVAAAADRVASDYGGFAERLWIDSPTAEELQRRLRAFDGIGQKKAAMAVDLVMRELGYEVRRPSGTDVAYDVHVRRVFLRTGIVGRDSPDEVVGAARELSPDRPAALDYPSWHVGRVYCRPRVPVCERCPLAFACTYAERQHPLQSRQLLLFQA